MCITSDFRYRETICFAISPISWLSLTWCFNIILVSAQLNFLRVDRVVSAAGGHCLTLNLPFFSSIYIFPSLLLCRCLFCSFLGREYREAIHSVRSASDAAHVRYTCSVRVRTSMDSMTQPALVTSYGFLSFTIDNLF